MSRCDPTLIPQSAGARHRIPEQHQAQRVKPRGSSTFARLALTATMAALARGRGLVAAATAVPRHAHAESSGRPPV